MQKRLLKYTGIVIAMVVLLTASVYIAVMQYYKNGFAVNTWINGVYCTGKTVEEVNAELLLDTKAPIITILGRDGEKVEISLASAAYQEDYLDNLQGYLGSQNELLWPKYLFQEHEILLSPIVSWDEDKLKELVLNTGIVQKEIRDEETIDVQILYGENGYEFYDGMTDVFDAQGFAELVVSNVKNGIYTTDITDDNCYYVQEDSPQQAQTRALWQELNDFLTIDLIFDMGAEKIVFDKSITSDLLLLSDSGTFLQDSEGNFLWDVEKIEAFIDELVIQYNTCDTELTFHATSGEVVEVPYVTYGTEIDAEVEKEYLKDALLNRVEETHVPTYIQEGYVRGLNDIGDTYIEVDMTNQKLYGYKNGEIVVETDIVTGNMRRNWDTPEGVNFVYNKQKNRVLRGEGYASPVDFWMPVKGAIGIHDADWRKEFGGEIYLRNGSHGCINVPVDVMPTVYEEFEIGTPVIMFY